MIRMLLSAVLLGAAIVVAAILQRQPDAPPPAAPAGETAPPPAPAPVVHPTAGPGEVAFTLDEATLTQQMNAGLAGSTFGDTPLGPATVRNLSVQLQHGQIVVTGTAQVGPTPLPVRVAGTLAAQAGRPRLGLSEARLGGVQLPETARRSLEQSLQGQIDQALGSERVRVQSITIGEGRLTVIGARA